MDCGCKKPLYDNTFFYKSIKECLEKGFRSCKVCRPLSWEFSQVITNDDTHIYEYISWLQKNKFPDKSYKKHPISSLENLTKIKQKFQKIIGISFVLSYKGFLQPQSILQKMRVVLIAA
jgi:methylphosphotriester-DNA--protein-cysteine methyltransferase